MPWIGNGSSTWDTSTSLWLVRPDNGVGTRLCLEPGSKPQSDARPAHDRVRVIASVMNASGLGPQQSGSCDQAGRDRSGPELEGTSIGAERPNRPSVQLDGR